MRPFLVYGVETDPHVNRVVDLLRQRGAKAAIIPAWPAEGVYPSLTWRPTRASTSEVDALVWLRNKHRIGNITSPAKQHEWVGVTTTGAFLAGLGGHADGLVNPGWHPAGGDNKMAQLKLALSVGFTIPDTLVSNDRGAVMSFLQPGAEYIVKPLASPGVPGIAGQPDSGFLLPTRIVTRSDVESYPPEALAMAPCIFQTAIQKDHELRILATRTSQVCIKIHSQSFALSKVDWRLGDGLVHTEVTGLPSGLRPLLTSYLIEADLDFAVFDFAVTPAGEAVFFESNPGGQWAAMEEEVDPIISAVVADCIFDRLQITPQPANQ